MAALAAPELHEVAGPGLVGRDLPPDAQALDRNGALFLTNIRLVHRAVPLLLEALDLLERLALEHLQLPSGAHGDGEGEAAAVGAVGPLAEDALAVVADLFGRAAAGPLGVVAAAVAEGAGGGEDDVVRQDRRPRRRSTR